MFVIMDVNYINEAMDLCLVDCIKFGVDVYEVIWVFNKTTRRIN